MSSRWLLMSAAALAGVALNGCGGSLNGGMAGAAGGGTAGTGGTASGGTGGTTSGGTGGTTGDAGSGFGQPVCPTSVSSAIPCAPSDPQICYKPCGPEQIGAKSYTCTGGLYQQMPNCSFDPTRDYSCYKIPTAANTVCLSGVTPQAAAPCDVAPCTLCNSLQGLTGGLYLDTAGAAKVGYCVCKPPGASGIGTWSCGTDGSSWPCPGGIGC